jgi:hypothetical protein
MSIAVEGGIASREEEPVRGSGGERKGSRDNIYALTNKRFLGINKGWRGLT